MIDVSNVEKMNVCTFHDNLKCVMDDRNLVGVTRYNVVEGYYVPNAEMEHLTDRIEELADKMEYLTDRTEELSKVDKSYVYWPQYEEGKNSKETDECPYGMTEIGARCAWLGGRSDAHNNVK